MAENLLLTGRDPGYQVKIIDFGLAKLLDAENVTQTFLGTKVPDKREILSLHPVVGIFCPRDASASEVQQSSRYMGSWSGTLDFGRLEPFTCM